MEVIKLIGRGSRLSLLQMEKVKQKIELALPSLQIEIVVKDSRGDALRDVPLHTVEGSDFFTQDIFDSLANGEADIAVHSLKDMSSEHFFGSNTFAVIDRDDVRDVVIFRKEVVEKISRGENIIIGTCSPRREEMAIGFLQKALPQLHPDFHIETKSIRGNVDTRLRKLDTGEFDGIILATAGLNRLLDSKKDAPAIKELLEDKKLMLLPLIECVPAPCQGAIVAEANPENSKAVAILNTINDAELFQDAVNEKREANKYGKGCLQRFGVATLSISSGKLIYAAGKDSQEREFKNWSNLPPQNTNLDNWFSSTDYMKDFFEYEWNRSQIPVEQSFVFIANFKVIQNFRPKEALQAKTIWVSGTKTWFELAKQGYWVQGCADALGFEWLLPSLQMPLLNIHPKDICILTHNEAAERWRQKGYYAIGNYKLVSVNNKTVADDIAAADHIFWSSFSQYQYYGQFAKDNATHYCPGGETASLLKKQGIEPVIFPTIKSFEQWRKFSSRPLSVA